MYITYCGISRNKELRLKALEYYQKAGITSIQTYIYWKQVEKEPGTYDWDIYDEEVNDYRAYCIKWVPFIILGPYYTTPDWVRKATGEHYYRCLEHGRESKIISLWNKELKSYIEKFLESFAEHYIPQNVLESVLLGITGDYGEAIYPVFGNRPLDYHTHYGFWCGDDMAVKDYKMFLETRYGRIDSLNKELSTGFNSFDDIVPVLRKNANDKQWLVQIEWYRKSINDYAEFWLKTAKKHFHNIPVYLCTGGRGTNNEGSDFSLQVKTCAKYGADIRITNESSDYFVNFISTRLIASAGKYYGISYGFEPCSSTTRIGMVSRIFNVLSSGAEQLFDYVMNNLEFDNKSVNKKESFDVLEKYMPFLKSGEFSKPRVDVAVVIPSTQWTLEGETYLSEYIEKCKQIRMITDFDFVDERMIMDGALNNYRYTISVFTSVVDSRIVPELEKWVKNGGILITSSRLVTIDGASKALDKLIGLTEASDEVWGVQFNNILNTVFLSNVLKSDKKYFSKHGFTNFSDSVTVLSSMESAEIASSIWYNKYGNGLCFVYTGPMGVDLDTWMEDSYMYSRLIKDCLFNISVIDASKQNLIEFNKDYNETYTSQFDDGILILNFNEYVVNFKINNTSKRIQPYEIIFVKAMA